VHQNRRAQISLSLAQELAWSLRFEQRNSV
jgi:hypothetical protein